MHTDLRQSPYVNYVITDPRYKMMPDLFVYIYSCTLGNKVVC